MNRTINIKKKNLDGSYDESDYLFPHVDLYNGTTAEKLIEISPNGSIKAYNVKLEIEGEKNGVKYKFTPDDKDEYSLTSLNDKGLSFYLKDVNNIKYRPDKNGIISITNVLSIPMEFYFVLKAEPYTVTSLDETITMQHININVWSSADE